MRKLYRSRDSKWIAGVCGGIGERFNISPMLVRVVFVLASTLLVVVIYLAAWALIPQKPPEDTNSYSQ